MEKENQQQQLEQGDQADVSAELRRKMLQEWKEKKQQSTTPKPSKVAAPLSNGVTPSSLLRGPDAPATPVRMQTSSMTPIRAATSFSALAHKTSVSLTHQPMSTIKAQQQQQQAKSVLVPPPTPTQQLQDRLRSLNATPVASPAVKLGRKLQTMRELGSMANRSALPLDIPEMEPLSSFWSFKNNSLDLEPKALRFDDSAPSEPSKPICPTPATALVKEAPPPKQALKLEGWYTLKVGNESSVHYAFPRNKPLIKQAAAAGLFSLLDAAALAKRGESDAARIVFKMLLADEKKRKEAHTWVTYAYFEEQCSNLEKVVEIYEQAVAAKAEPKQELEQGLRWFTIRSQERAKANEVRADESENDESFHDCDSGTNALDDEHISPAAGPPSPVEASPTTPDFLVDMVRRLNFDTTEIVGKNSLFFDESESTSVGDLTDNFSIADNYKDTAFNSQTPSPIGLSSAAADHAIDVTPFNTRNLPSQAEAAASSLVESSRIRFAAITPRKQLKESVGSDVVFTPVRRSMRTPSRPRPKELAESYMSVDSIDQIPADMDFAFVPNAALLRRQQEEQKQALRNVSQTPQQTKTFDADQIKDILQTFSAVKDKKKGKTSRTSSSQQD